VKDEDGGDNQQQQQDDEDEDQQQDEDAAQQQQEPLPELTGQLKWLYHLTTARNFFKQCSHCKGSSGAWSCSRCWFFFIVS
jgi:hypothetical protein